MTERERNQERRFVGPRDGKINNNVNSTSIREGELVRGGLRHNKTVTGIRT